MAGPKLFITGATGYVGGDALSVINAAHPDWSYTCLVRNSSRGAILASKYPHLRLVYGDLANIDLIQKEAHDADIVLHFADCDDEPSARAIAAGINSKSPADPGYWIHTSGALLLVFPDQDRKSFGEGSDKTYDDIKDIEELKSLPDHAEHRKVDKIVQAAASPQCKTAIVNPPAIYGVGRGAGNTRSEQLPKLIRFSLQRGSAFQVGPGKTRWANVHVHDLSKGYLLLAEAAAAGGGKATWGKDGYYFAENGEQAWGTISHEVAKCAKRFGLLKTDQVDSLTAEQVDSFYADGSILWGGNARYTASRLRSELGWKPNGLGLVDTIEEQVNIEQKILEEESRAS